MSTSDGNQSMLPPWDTTWPEEDAVQCGTPPASHFVAVARHRWVKVSIPSGMRFAVVDRDGDYMSASGPSQEPFDKFVTSLLDTHNLWKIWITGHRLYAAILKTVTYQEAMESIAKFQVARGEGSVRAQPMERTSREPATAASSKETIMPER